MTMTTFGKVMIVIIISVIQIIVTGLVLVQLWKWFIMPVFAVESINIPEAIGISLFVGFITYKESPIDKRAFIDQMSAKVAILLVVPPMVLLIGWIVTQFLQVMKKTRKRSKPRSIEAIMLTTGKKYDEFYSHKADKDLTALANYYNREITTERMILIGGTKESPTVYTIVKVILL